VTGGKNRRVADVVDRALTLWTAEPLPAPEALEAFRTVYTDPLRVNGAVSPLEPLVDRARMLHGAFEGLHHELFERVDTPGRSAIAFRLSGRHTGPLTTPLGEVPPTGKVLDVLGLDILSIADDRVTAVWAVADWLGLLMQAGQVALRRA
jgi:hypothetical protein